MFSCMWDTNHIYVDPTFQNKIMNLSPVWWKKMNLSPDFTKYDLTFQAGKIMAIFSCRSCYGFLGWYSKKERRDMILLFLRRTSFRFSIHNRARTHVCSVPPCNFTCRITQKTLFTDRNQRRTSRLRSFQFGTDDDDSN